MKLYSSAKHRGQWVAYVPGSGWVAFPAKPNGWVERAPARGLDPVHLREAPLSAAAETGMLEPDQELARAS